MLARLDLVEMLGPPLHAAAEEGDVDRLVQLAKTVSALVTVLVADATR